MLLRAPFRRNFLPFALTLAVGVGVGSALSGGALGPSAHAKQGAKAQQCPDYGVFAQALDLLEREYVRPLDRQRLLEAGVSGMSEILDPHTSYLNPREAKLLREEIDGAFGGVGLVVQWELEWLDPQGKALEHEPLSQKERAQTPHRVGLRIKSVVPDSPAQAAGLLPEDVIVSIQGRAIAQFPHLGAAVMKMRGPVDTEVRFRVQRGAKEFPIKVKRARVLAAPLSLRKLGEGVLHLEVREFSGGVAASLRKQLKMHVDSKSKLILDLRDNGGGLLDEAVDMADLFVERGILVRTRGREGRELEQHRARRRGTMRDIPLVVLVNKGSASASEIVAGALQDHERALIVGERSFGKGSVQVPFGLSGGGMLKTTIALYYTPKDRVIQARGIAPDLWVSAQAAQFVDSRPQLKSERDDPQHLRPPGSTASPSGELDSGKVPAQRLSLRASASDPQLRAAVEYLLAADRLSQD